MKKFLAASALAFWFASVAFAFEPLWTGTWKLDPARSHFTGETITYSMTTSGMMHYSDGGGISYDGKSYTDVGGNPGKPAEKTTGLYVKQ